MSTYLILGASSDLGCELIRNIIDDAQKKAEETEIYAHFGTHSECLMEIARQNQIECGILSELAKRNQTEYEMPGENGEQSESECEILGENGEQNASERVRLAEKCGYVNQLHNSKISMYLLQADLSSEDSVHSLIELMSEHEICPDHVIHFAADRYQYNRLSDWNPERVQKNMQIQVWSFADILRKLMPEMQKKKDASAVFMLSSVINDAPKYLSEYVCVKHALYGLMQSMAADCEDTSVRICAVAPSMIETKFVKGIGRKLREMAAEASPLGRNLTPEEVTPVIYELMQQGRNGPIHSWT